MPSPGSGINTVVKQFLMMHLIVCVSNYVMRAEQSIQAFPDTRSLSITDRNVTDYPDVTVRTCYLASDNYRFQIPLQLAEPRHFNSANQA